MNENIDLENPLFIKADEEEEEKEKEYDENSLEEIKAKDSINSLPNKLNQNYKSSFNMKWVFNQMLNMNFSEETVIGTLNHFSLEDQSLTKEELLNLAIDTCLAAEFDDNNLLENGFPSSSSFQTQGIINISSDTSRNNRKKLLINSNEIDSQKNCRICYEIIKEEEKFAVPRCEHKFCQVCIFDYVKTLVNDGKVLKIKCPHETCSNELKEMDVKEILLNDAEILRKYAKFKKNIEISMDPKHRWCIRPGCEFLVEGNSKNPKTTCKCGQVMCFNCMYPWHEGKNCESAIDQEYRNYADKGKVKTCPKCKSRIEKNEGCNHIHCTRCKYDFCWLCNKEYKAGHYDWYNLFGCPMMMYTRLNDSKFHAALFCIKKFLYITGIFLVALILIGLILGLVPVVLLAIAMAIPVLVYIKVFAPRKNLKGISMGVIIFILGLPLVPFIIVLGAPGALIYLCFRNQLDQIIL